MAIMKDKPLTKREVQVLALAASGLSAKAIAKKLDISEKTVVAHLANGRQKLGAENTPSAVAIAIRAGIIASICCAVLINGFSSDQITVRRLTRNRTRITRNRDV